MFTCYNLCYAHHHAVFYAGAFFRIIGRATLQAVYTVTPKLQTIIRILLTGDDEAEQLRQTINRLQEENYKLQQAMARRNALDEMLVQYTMEELKSMARTANVPVSGTKDQILSRLIDIGVITLP